MNYDDDSDNEMSLVCEFKCIICLNILNFLYFIKLSNGAEVIMINKSFYSKNANNLVINCIRVNVDSMPNTKYLEDKLNVLNSWKVYKNKTLIDAFKFKTYKR